MGIKQNKKKNVGAPHYSLTKASFFLYQHAQGAHNSVQAQIRWCNNTFLSINFFFFCLKPDLVNGFSKMHFSSVGFIQFRIWNFWFNIQLWAVHTYKCHKKSCTVVYTNYYYSLHTFSRCNVFFFRSSGIFYCRTH